MLLWLSVRNFVLVESLEIEFEPGFTVLTGETGAGKSILLDAIGLLLGNRFESRQFRNNAERAELAAGFSILANARAYTWLTEHDFLDDNDPATLVLRRVQDTNNKNRVWINGRSATLAQLNALGATLIELHGQHEHQSLTRTPTQRQWLDAYAQNADLLASVSDAWRAWRSANESLAIAQRSQGERDAEKALLTQRHEDLSALAPQPDEWENLNIRQRQLNHADMLLATIEEGQTLLQDAEDAILSRLFHLSHKLRVAGTHEPSMESVAAQLDNAAIEIEEAARTLRDYARSVDLDPKSLASVENRLSALHEIARKYRTRPEDLPVFAQETLAALVRLEQSVDIEALTRATLEAENHYREYATELTAARRRAAEKLQREVGTAMNELAMPGGRFKVLIAPAPRPESHGIDIIEFQISTHPGQMLAPLAKVASGGELSRISLALLTVLAQTGGVPTLVFDEIDTGIGGATGHTIGQRLRALGNNRQVLCVTHLPQVAACAHQHWRATKEGDRREVVSRVDLLNQNERIEEIARMLGGATVTTKTRAHAKELLAQTTKD
ncbi:MAG: DNA repair protein RecN [Burkholderiales bacterium]|jgi:DNA repair protein RecN (Recombination protein N)|nr:DNA repair protein RecN [Burkholderiales bacterium]